MKTLVYTAPNEVTVNPLITCGEGRTSAVRA
jgi:hypothetical protein